MTEFLATLAFLGIGLTAITGILTPALLFFILAFAIETRMKVAKLCGRLDTK